MKLMSSKKFALTHRPPSIDLVKFDTMNEGNNAGRGDEKTVGKKSAHGDLERLGKSVMVTLGLLSASTLFAQNDSTEAGTNIEGPIKFALFSAAWGENTDDGLRLVAQNLTKQAITLEKIRFIGLPSGNKETDLNLSLSLRPERYAQTNLPLVDLLTGDECVARTMADGWKLVEISNYTLNPSVRNLIIENTNSFRIYQCVRSASLTWRSDANADTTEQEGWVLYHFESRSN